MKTEKFQDYFNMTKIILVRHGQSQSNSESRFAGQTDSPLTDLGKEQAELTAKYIKDNFKIDLVYASDLQRAYYTGAQIAEYSKVPIIKNQGMREIFVGKWENQGVNVLLKRDDYKLWLTDIVNAEPEGGETVRDFAKRIMDTLNQIVKDNPNKTVVVATHATPVRVLETVIQTGGIDKMQNSAWVSNASCSVFNYENDKWSIEQMDICEHLEGKVTRIMDPREKDKVL